MKKQDAELARIWIDHLRYDILENPSCSVIAKNKAIDYVNWLEGGIE